MPRRRGHTLVDLSVGQILDTMDRLKLSDNTLVIVTSDNRPLPGENGHKSAGYWRGYKCHIWESGHRVPFIARWPVRIEPRDEYPKQGVPGQLYNMEKDPHEMNNVHNDPA